MDVAFEDRTAEQQQPPRLIMLRIAVWVTMKSEQSFGWYSSAIVYCFLSARFALHKDMLEAVMVQTQTAFLWVVDWLQDAPPTRQLFLEMRWAPAKIKQSFCGIAFGDQLMSRALLCSALLLLVSDYHLPRHDDSLTHTDGDGSWRLCETADRFGSLRTVPPKPLITASPARESSPPHFACP